MPNFEEKFNQQPSNILELVELAEANNDEGWEKIDSELPSICNNLDVIQWARDNTMNKSDGLRDLAGTIFEASNIILTPKDIQTLQELMNDEGYPGFRAACALAKRISSPEIVLIKDDIKANLKNFINDDDVSEIANEYLNILDL